MDSRVFLLVVVVSLFSLCLGGEKQGAQTTTTLFGAGLKGTTTSLETATSTTSTAPRDCPGAKDAFKAYSDAEKLYSAGDCMNASRSASKAMKTYNDCGYAEEMSRTGLLLENITSCLNDKAGRLYPQALLLFASRNLSAGIQKANEAKALFKEAKNESGVEHCDLLIKEMLTLMESANPGMCGIKEAGLGYNISNCDDSCQSDEDCKYLCGCGAINVNENCDTSGVEFDCVNTEVKCLDGKCMAKPQDGAGKDLWNALSLYDAQDYAHAYDAANRSMILYEKQGDKEGSAKCISLLQKISSRMDQIRSAAESGYKNATEKYDKAENEKNTQDYPASIDDYLAAIGTAQNSKIDYAKIGDANAYSKSQALILDATMKLTELENPARSIADASQSLGENASLACREKTGEERSACYKEALKHFDEALDLYAKLYQIAKYTGQCTDLGSCKELTDTIDACKEKKGQAIGDFATMDNGSA